jgi:methionyl-tRNA formyltransferase
VHEAGYEIPLVVSAPDRRRGRGSATTPSPVKAAAIELGIPVSADPDAVLGAGAELAVVVAYGRLLKPHLLAEIPMVNLHFSLLPRWRGAAPVERAILAGDRVTGVCLMVVEEGLDTGAVYASSDTEVGGKTLEELRAELVQDGIELLLGALRDGFETPRPQQGEATYAHKVDPTEHRLDWSMAAVDVWRHVRIGDAWTTFRGKRVKVRAATPSEAGSARPVAAGTLDGADGLDVVCGDGATLRLVDLQPEGKGQMSALAWRNGAQPTPDERFD